MITLQDRPCHRAWFSAGYSGRWTARVKLDGAAPAGRVTLRWGNATLIGGVEPQTSNAWQDEGTVTIVGGLGWSTVLPAQWHQNDAGLQGLTIARQAATLAGETLDAPATAFRALQVSYARPNAPASKTLQSVLAKQASWWVEYGGTTRAGTRPSPAAPARVEVLNYEPGQRRVELDADDISQTLVGAVIAAAAPRQALRIVGFMAEIGDRGQRILADVQVVS